MKGIATAFVMTVRDAQPHYEHQHEILGILVEALYEDSQRAYPQYIDSIFRTDYAQLGTHDDDARLRLVIDQVASLTDRSGLCFINASTEPLDAGGEAPVVAQLSTRQRQKSRDRRA